MRLNPRELAAIRNLARRHFGASAVIRLFGSRADDAKRGGDIDLHVVAEDTMRALPAAEGAFEDALESALGPRRVDVVLRTPGEAPRAIDLIAERDGVRLVLDPEHAALAEALAAAGKAAGRRARLRERIPAANLLPAPEVGAPPRSEDDEVLIDAFLLRYGSLAALLQDGVFRTLAILEGEAERNPTNRDRANLMEKLGVIASAEAFAEAIRTRNALAHADPPDSQAQNAVINGAWMWAPVLLRAWDQAGAYAVRRLSIGGTNS